jgi:arylsulfatase A-like enzyme
MRSSLFVVFAVVCCQLVEATEPAGIATAKPVDEPKQAPNIVFLLIDDLGYADVGFNGCKVIQTPQIDRLAQGGAVLESHYVQPVCSPTRAAFLTGRYATRTGVYTVVRPHARWGLPLTERTLATALQEANYETAIVGKWHLGEFDRAYLPTSRGFDHQYGHSFGALDYFTHLRDGTHDWSKNDQDHPESGYSTHLIADEACRRIAERDHAKPLFLYVPFNAVHAPLQVPERYLEPYADIPGNRRLMAGMLSAVDEAIGRIVEALDTAGIRDNTLIVFSSDNGGPNPRGLSDNGVLRAGKGTLYEGGVRACAFANWPGQITAGRRIQQPVHVVDWYPTLITLAGGSLKQTAPIDGLDIAPVLTSEAESPHDAILLVQTRQRAAIRMGDWKLLVNATEDASESSPEPKRKAAKKRAKRKNPAPPPVELFNLKQDLSESKNLADQEPQRVTTMRAQLEQMLKDAVPPGHLTLEPK